MKRLFSIAGLLLFLWVFSPAGVNSQSPPPPPSSHNMSGDQPPLGGNAPLGDGLVFLIGSAVLYAGIRLAAGKLRRVNQL